MPSISQILVVDDEPSLCGMLTREFEHKGYAVSSAYSGAQALRLFPETPFDVVILDIVLGDIDGLMVLEKLRPQRRETHFIMLTAHASPESEGEAQRLGAYSYLRKGPSVLADVTSTVARALAETDKTSLPNDRPAQFDRKALSGPALRTFFRIAELWQLSAEEQRMLLGSPSSETFTTWTRIQDMTLSQDTLERISYILGIYKALQILLPDQQAADEWIRKPNTASPFGGRSALDRMLSGHMDDLAVVRRYLDAQRGE